MQPLPAKKFTRLGASVFRLGPKVHKEAVNLAFVQSIAMDIEENLQVANLGDKIAANQLPAYVDMRYVDGGYVINTPGGLEYLQNTSNLIATDKMIQDVGGIWTVSSWDGTDQILLKHKLYSIWWHVESNPITVDGDELQDIDSATYANETRPLVTWYRYAGSNIKVKKLDGSLYDGASAIYIRPYSLVSGAKLKNLWKVLVYVEDATDIAFLEYDKGEVRGYGITDVTDYEQAYDESVVPISMICESLQRTARAWMIDYGYVVLGTNIGIHVRIFFGDHAMIQVKVPETADNHGAWFAEVKKGTFAIDVTNAEASNLTLSSESHIKLQQLRAKFLALHGTEPDTIRFTYSTEEYARNRQGHAYGSAFMFSGGVSGVIGEDFVDLPYPVYPAMPIIVLITENFSDSEQVWVITNVLDDHNRANPTLIADMLSRWGVAWYDGIHHAGTIQGAGILPIVGVHETRVFYDNVVQKYGRIFPKYFTTLASVRAFYYHKNDWVEYTGYREAGTFYPLDLNPSVGHSFAGKITKELVFDVTRNVWKTGVYGLAPSDITLYDITYRSPDGTNVPAIIPQSRWDPSTHRGTDLSKGEFEIDNSAGHRVMLSCTSMAIPGYNLFTSAVNIKMLPCKMTASDDNYSESLPVYPRSEKIVFDTDGNMDAVSWDVQPLAIVQVVPNTIYGQNEIFDTRSRGGGLQETVSPVAGERHFWDIGCMDGVPYTGNQVIVIEVPVTAKTQFLEQGLTEDQVEALFQAKVKRYVAKGSLVMIQYV